LNAIIDVSTYPVIPKHPQHTAEMWGNLFLTGKDVVAAVREAVDLAVAVVETSQLATIGT
jgi:hypothetical protein